MIPGFEIQRVAESCHWDIFMPTVGINYRVSDLWLAELEMTIEQYADFIKMNGFPRIPKPPLEFPT